jgi:tRNA G18 (ribose-2'-O)-methylase SpoU
LANLHKHPCFIINAYLSLIFDICYYLDGMLRHIQSIDDPEIRYYLNLKDKDLEVRAGLFVVEGEHLVRRLLASNLAVHSVLMTNQRFEQRIWPVPPDVPVYLAEAAAISAILGFNFHRGVLAMGIRPHMLQLHEFLHPDVKRIVICPEINDVENLGSIMRTAAALGYQHLLLGPSCCDFYARRALRTSMGGVFKLKICRVSDMTCAMQQIKMEYRFQLHAAVLDEKAVSLAKIRPPQKVALVFGAEAAGLTQEYLAECDRMVTIPMSMQTDSLNVATAAAIFMYYYRDK